MKTIKEILNAKEQATVQTIGPDESILSAVTRMVEHSIGAMLVVENNVLKGVLTERDYLRFVADRGRTARDTAVSELMTTRVVYVTPGTSMDEAMAIMTDQRIRHLPVMEDGKLTGIVSIGDLVKQTSVNQQVKISILEDYISDPYPGPSGKK